MGRFDVNIVPELMPLWIYGYWPWLILYNAQRMWFGEPKAESTEVLAYPPCSASLPRIRNHARTLNYNYLFTVVIGTCSCAQYCTVACERVNTVFRSRLGATFRKCSYIILFNLATCCLMIMDNTHLSGGSIQWGRGRHKFVTWKLAV